MTGFRRKRLSGLSTSSVISIQGHMAGTTKDEAHLASSGRPASIRSGDGRSVPQALPHKQIYDSIPLVDEQALQRSLDCEEIALIRTQQLEEKRRFLEYQTNLIKDLLAERDRRKAEAQREHQRRLAEQEERIEKAVEALEARQLEDELKQQKDHEAEKRAIQTRLKHMEAYCQTPSPPQSPTNPAFELRASVDSMRSLPERHVTQQHYENLAQAYHIRDNMDGLHASKINVLRGKQKKTLQNFIMKKERELEQMERAHKAELDSIDVEYASQEAEIRQEFLLKRTKLEARWKLQALVEKTKAERSTGLKHEGLPDVIAAEA
ncbi:hypothetical protein LTS08_000628 [Lithohypha guttulata]|nr:hypothetical protein LTR51_006989 [Lithohypha guttulata]KAK5106509.1 hypothetical protein LTS08_000628 [Lithohypha guttulata]